MRNEWLNGWETTPTFSDIWLTTNGGEDRPMLRNVSLHAESFLKKKPAYDIFPMDNRWVHRFHFNPYYAKFPNCTEQRIGCFWKSELLSYKNIKKEIKYEFGMVLGYKPPDVQSAGYFAHVRKQVVECLKGRSFKYYGTDWHKNDPADPNYQGEIYIAGSRGDPAKFSDARKLLSDVKFVFALENTFHEVYSVNYLTEKMFHGFLSKSVPIYAGCWNIQELVPDNLYIDLRKFGMSIPKAVEHCENMPDSEYSGYIARIEEWLSGQGLEFSSDNRFVQLDLKLTQI